jgi:hypothetical protein
VRSFHRAGWWPNPGHSLHMELSTKYE